MTLTTVEGSVEGSPLGMDWSADRTVHDLFLARAHRTPLAAPVLGAGEIAGDRLDNALWAVGRMLGKRLLPAELAEKLAAETDAAARTGESVHLAIEVADDHVGDLPWETLILPGQAEPLVLNPSVRLYRSVTGPGSASVTNTRGPLRILAVIASPKRGGGELLDYESELARILEAVGPVRGRKAYVRVLNGGSRKAIRAALELERFHILHLSCHAEPGQLILEADDGSADRTNTKDFTDIVLAPGRGVPLVVLAGCSTAQAPIEGDSGHSGSGSHGAAGSGDEPLPGLAQGLLARGVPAVLAMTSSVTDDYAADLTSRFYGELVNRHYPEPLAAFSDARRAAEASRVARADAQKGLSSSARPPAEWAVPALFLNGPSTRLYDPGGPDDTITEPVMPVLAEGIVVRRVGDFVGRRGELRSLANHLSADLAGVVIHGLGGVGKSALATEFLATLGEKAGLLVSLTGRVGVNEILAAVAGRLVSWCSDHEADDTIRGLAERLSSGRVAWVDGLGLLAEHLLPVLPVTLFLDHAESLLTPTGAGTERAFADEQVGAFVAAWTALPGRARLLITSRFPLPVDRDTGQRLTHLHLGPLSSAETRKLLWRLPALDRLEHAEKIRVIADVGGHPRALEYLDAILAGGPGRFGDVTGKVEAALRARGISDPAAWRAEIHVDLNRALAETVMLVGDDVFLDDLLARLDTVPHARRLITGAAVYRRRVDADGLVWQISEPLDHSADSGLDAQNTGQPRRPLASPDGFEPAWRVVLDLGLLAPAGSGGSDDTARFIVYRWIATAILRRAEDEDRTAAHRAAAAYWQWCQDRSASVTQLLEAGHHHLEAGDIDHLKATTYKACDQLHTLGEWDREEDVCRHTLDRLPRTGQLTAAFHQQLGVLAWHRGNLTEAEDSCNQSLALFERVGDRLGIATNLHQLGIVARMREDYSAAEDYYQRACVIFLELGDRAGVASNYGELGNMAQARGAYPAAEDYYQRACVIFVELGDRPGIARSTHQLGIVAQDQGKYTAAEALYLQSLAIGEDLGDLSGIANSLHQLGRIAELRGYYPVAEDYYQRAREIADDLGDRAGVARTSLHLGILAELQGYYPVAKQCCRQAHDIFEKLGDRFGIAASLHQLGLIVEHEEDYSAAEGFYREALAIHAGFRDRPAVSACLHQLGMVAELRGEYLAAEELYRQSLAIDEELGDEAGIAGSLHQLGMIAQARGEYADAEDLYHRSLAITRRIGDRVGAANSVHQLGLLDHVQGDHSSAEDRCRRANAIFVEIGDRAGIAVTTAQLGILAAEKGRIADAVYHHLQALNIHVEIGAPEVSDDVFWLARLRQQLGDDTFRTLLARNLSADEVTPVLALITSGTDDT
ncbi:tetratricopeptide repeat protein [Frankia tisae]|uniref:tetratricopeptide repeat protein n=1 Tax=Frankia tisae TaxID=2950104 RepID=UPI0021BE7CCA|nr:tetratricopeptide repeat protein [Frankia tisae]